MEKANPVSPRVFVGEMGPWYWNTQETVRKMNSTTVDGSEILTSWGW